MIKSYVAEELIRIAEGILKVGYGVVVRDTKYGEKLYTWENYVHPDNPDFQQLVFWKAYHKVGDRYKDSEDYGKYSIGYALEPAGKIKWVLFGKGDIMPAIEKLRAGEK